MSMNFVKPTRRQFLAGSAALGAASITGSEAGIRSRRLEEICGHDPRGQSDQEPARRYPAEVPEGIRGPDRDHGQLPNRPPSSSSGQKAVIELTSGKPSFDVIHISYHVQKRQFEKAGWLADLTPFLKDPSLTEPSLTESDFAAGRPLAFAKDKNGRFGGLPFSVDYWIVYWNKELFAAKGVEYPKDLRGTRRRRRKADRQGRRRSMASSPAA